MLELLEQLAWVALGAAPGGVARFFVSGFVGRRYGETFPWGTIAVNATGAVAIGALAAALPATDSAWQLLAVGFLGSYTTVSSFSLQTLALAENGEWRRAGGNVLASVVLCLFGVAIGFGILSAAIGAP